jgi:hypothetical protein
MTRFIINKGSENNTGANALSYKIIDVIQFNYDGKGSAICFCDDEPKAAILNRFEVDYILLNYIPDINLKRDKKRS